MSIDFATAPPRQLAPTFWDPLSEVRFEIHRPYERPDLWEAYLEGAAASYRQHGVEAALELGAVRSGLTTAVFIVGIDLANQVVGGARFQGPMLVPEDVHVTEEWAGHPGADTVRQVIEQRVPQGIIEAKAIWVDPTVSSRSAITDALARSYVHAMDHLGVRFACCSSALHSLPRWQSSGGTLVPGLRPIPYPDDRYETTMLWWDRLTLDTAATPLQWERIRSERYQLGRQPMTGLPVAAVDLPLGSRAQEVMSSPGLV